VGASLQVSVTNSKGQIADQVSYECSLNPGKNEVECVLSIADVDLWDEFSPSLYQIDCRLESAECDGNSTVDAITFRIGLRHFTTQGRRFVLNQRAINLRSNNDAGAFPDTGYPSMAIDDWRKIFQTTRDWGLNHVRFHSWCPPHAAFKAADELGMYLQVEAGVWANQGVTLGDGEPLDAWLHNESHEIQKAFGNHASFMMFAHGNEPAGERHEQYLTELVESWKGRNDNRRLYTASAKYPHLPVKDYHNPSGLQLHGGGHGLKGYLNATPPNTVHYHRKKVCGFDVPVLAHEVGQWCVFPNLDQIGSHRGLLKAKNFEIVRENLQQNGILDRWRDFHHASGKLQELCYREEIEASLRTPDYGGFSLLGLNDFPGQGNALVGVLDVFWQEKGYVDREQWRRFCGPTVLLARLPKRLLLSSETIAVDIELSHFGPTKLDAEAHWRLCDPSSGEVMARGELPAKSCLPGGLYSLGRADIAVPCVSDARQLRLDVELTDGVIANDWSVWVYPDQPVAEPEQHVLISRRLGDTEWLHLQSGGRLIVSPEPSGIPTDAQIAFTGIFWNSSWTINHPPHTLGIFCDPAHPALAGFPTPSHTDWPWWDVLRHSAAMRLEVLSKELVPIVEVIDDWHYNRRLGLVFEARAAGGSLLVLYCSQFSGIGM